MVAENIQHTSRWDFIVSSAMKFLLYFVFIGFAVYCVRADITFIGYVDFKLQLFALAVISVICGFSWLWMRTALLLFIAGVPLIVGIQAVGVFYGWPLLEFVFANIYLTWFVRRLSHFFKSNNSRSHSEREPKSNLFSQHSDFAETIVSALAFVVIVSNLYLLSYYPFEFTSHQVFRPTIEGQMDPFFSIDASFLILQGLIFFLIFRNEELLNEATIQRIVFIHSAIILVFSIVQMIFHLPELHYKSFGVFSPFRDLHSFGSAAVVYFCIHGAFVFGGFHLSSNKLHLFFLIAFGILIVLSGSNVTIATMLLALLIFLILARKYRYALALGVAVAAIPIMINSLQVQSEELDTFFSKRLSRPFIASEFEDKYITRWIFWQRGAGMMEAFPVSGAGVGTFYRISPFFHPEEDTEFPNYYQNAHNYFIQFGAELGLPALLLFCTVIAMPILAGGKLLIHKLKNPPRLFTGVYLGFGFYVLTMLTGHPLLMAEQQYLFWFFLASLLFLIGKQTSLSVTREQLHKFVEIPTLGILCLLVVFHVKNRADAEMKNYDFEYGYAAQETIEGTPMRWTYQHALKRIQAESDVFGLKIYSPDVGGNNGSRSVSLRLNGKVLETVRFESEGSKILYFYLPGFQTGLQNFEVYVDKPVNLYEKGVKSEKKYDIPVGIGISEIEFLKIMPRIGIGFSSPEKWPAGRLPKEIHEQVPVYRTGKQATLNVQNELPSGGRLYFAKDLAQQNNYPIVLQLIGDGAFIQQIELADAEWHAVELDKDTAKNLKGLTILVEENHHRADQGKHAVEYNPGVAVIVEPNPSKRSNHAGSASGFFSGISGNALQRS